MSRLTDKVKPTLTAPRLSNVLIGSIRKWDRWQDHRQLDARGLHKPLIDAKLRYRLVARKFSLTHFSIRFIKVTILEHWYCQSVYYHEQQDLSISMLTLFFMSSFFIWVRSIGNQSEVSKTPKSKTKTQQYCKQPQKKTK